MAIDLNKPRPVWRWMNRTGLDVDALPAELRDLEVRDVPYGCDECGEDSIYHLGRYAAEQVTFEKGWEGDASIPNGTRDYVSVADDFDGRLAILWREIDGDQANEFAQFKYTTTFDDSDDEDFEAPVEVTASLQMMSRVGENGRDLLAVYNVIAN